MLDPSTVCRHMRSHFTSFGHDGKHLPCRDYVTPVNIDQIPTGELMPVKNTPFDFTTPRPIGSRIKQVSC